MSLNQANVKALQIALGLAADNAARESGITGLVALKGSRASYDPITGTVKVTVEFQIKTDAQERAAFDNGATMFGLKPEAYGATFTNRGTTYKLVGFDFKRRKFPVVATDPAGRAMLFTSEVLRKLDPSVRAGWGEL
jgi:hypothetical protein